MGRPVHDPATVKKIRRWAGKLNDAQMAAKLGLTKEQVAHIRRKHRIAGVAAGGLATVWTAERLQMLREMYFIQCRPAAEVAEAVGCGSTAERVRKRAADLAKAEGLKRDPNAAHRNYMAKRHPPKPAKPEPQKAITASDAELIAQYLAANQVTKCAPGWACGLTSWELATRTAPAPGASMRERSDRHRAKRRAA